MMVLIVGRATYREKGNVLVFPTPPPLRLLPLDSLDGRTQCVRVVKKEIANGYCDENDDGKKCRIDKNEINLCCRTTEENSRGKVLVLGEE